MRCIPQSLSQTPFRSHKGEQNSRRCLSTIILYHITYTESSVILHKYRCKCLGVLYIEKDVKSVDITPITMYNIDTEGDGRLDE